MLGNCTATVIDPTAVDAVKVDDNTVRMRTPAEFFDFNIGSFQYEGVVSYTVLSTELYYSS